MPTDATGNPTGTPEVLAPGSGPSAENTGVAAGSTGISFTATATGNIDGDPTIDQWHINDSHQLVADINDVTS